MKRARMVLLVGVLLLPGAVAMAIRHQRLDFSKEEPPFNEMRMPPEEVRTSVAYVNYCPPSPDLPSRFLVVYVKDRDGREFDIQFPEEEVTGRRVYGDALYEGEPLQDAARARELCVRLLRYFDAREDSYQELEK